MTDILKEVRKLKRAGYAELGLHFNPFSIRPLFDDPHDFREQEQFLEPRKEQAIRALSPLTTPEVPRRFLIYGQPGSGKTSFLNYISHSSTLLFEKEKGYIPVRLTISGDDNGLLHSIIDSSYSSINSRLSGEKNIVPILKKLLEGEEDPTCRHVLDSLISSQANGASSLSLEPISVQASITVLETFSRLAAELGYKGLVFGVDGCDKISPRETRSVLRNLSDLLFARNCFFYLVASADFSAELEKEDNSDLSGLFDMSLILLPTFSKEETRRLLDTYVQLASSGKKRLSNLFGEDVLHALTSQESLKDTIRLCEACVEEALHSGKPKVTEDTLNHILSRKREQTLLRLSKKERRAYDLVSKHKKISPSDKATLREYAPDITRSALNLMLLSLHKKDLLQKSREGKRTYYRLKLSKAQQPTSKLSVKINNQKIKTREVGQTR